MYCRNCGREIADNSAYCSCCGARIAYAQTTNDTDDRSSLGCAVLGFILPIAGLILYLVYDSKKPKKAKSAGKGALFGFITQSVLIIASLLVAYYFFAASFLNSLTNIQKSYLPNISDVFQNESTDDILKNDLDVTFGKFKVTGDKSFPETSLEVTVKNKSTLKCTFDITIEAVDKEGRRIETDTIYVEDLRSGQEMVLTAFEYVDDDIVGQLKDATFKVLEADKFIY